MDKIICLVGESGSGKSTIAELLEQKGFNYIQSYTTRKPRFEGEKGHVFVEIADYNYAVIMDLVHKNIIAYTFFDNEHYWATREQYKEKGTSIYVIDVAGIKELRERATDAEIVVIYLQTERKTRMNRMLMERDPCAVVDRIRHDKEAFKIVPCDYVVDANRDIEEVLNDIYLIIRSE